MSEQVIFIFKTLIKIPVYTLIVYIVFNCFAFAGAYFKMLGASHAVEMMVIEDNFLTQANREIIIGDDCEYGEANSFINSLVTNITPEVYLIDCPSSKSTDIINTRTITIGSDMGGSKSIDGVNLADEGVAGYAMLDDNDILVYNTGKPIRTQFGVPRTCGLIWTYKFILPLVPNEMSSNYNHTSNNPAVGGWSGFNGETDINSYDINTVTANSRRSAKERLGTFTIEFLYNIPGMKYYADLD